MAGLHPHPPGATLTAMLASYALPVEASRGRRYPEPPHPYRDDFQRDRDRIIHARAFRRLENKTQVFTRRLSDHFRTRLTHTIEVAQISRTIAAALHLNESLVETLALAHDIGHPPFGHSGERALDEAMQAHGLYFDHNLHALRIVESFEQRYASHPGLNLTFEVREGIIKHSHDYSAAGHPELAEYLLDQRPPLEAQLIDHTDEIAYNTADLDDGFEAGLLKLEGIRRGVSLFDRYLRQVEKEFTASTKLKFNEALKRMLNHLVTDLIDNTARRIAESGVQTVEDVRHHPERLATAEGRWREDRRRPLRLLAGASRDPSRRLPEARRGAGRAAYHLRLPGWHDRQLHPGPAPPRPQAVDRVLRVFYPGFVLSLP